MQQSSVIAGFILVGFLIFITGRGELPAYIAVLFGPVHSGSGSGSSFGSGLQVGATSSNANQGAPPPDTPGMTPLL